MNISCLSCVKRGGFCKRCAEIVAKEKPKKKAKLCREESFVGYPIPEDGNEKLAKEQLTQQKRKP